MPIKKMIAIALVRFAFFRLRECPHPTGEHPGIALMLLACTPSNNHENAIGNKQQRTNRYGYSSRYSLTLALFFTFARMNVIPSHFFRLDRKRITKRNPE
jgi:hypothetical protein